MFGRGRTALRFGRHKINVEHADRPTPIHPCFITNAPLADWVEHLKACGVAQRDGPVKRSGAEGLSRGAKRRLTRDGSRGIRSGYE